MLPKELGLQKAAAKNHILPTGIYEGQAQTID
jgi:hypothetical protein